MSEKDLSIDNYEFTDMYIAQSSSEYWSYPSWPSHLDHILISNELLGEELGASTLLIDYSLDNGWNQYNNIIIVVIQLQVQYSITS